MKILNEDLYGSAPDKCPVVLVIIDMINDFDFPDGEALFNNSLPAAKNIKALKNRAKKEHVPIIYVNDNFGKWKSDFKVLTEHVINENTLGKPIAEMLRPEPEDYFVLKPKHSGFYSTTLEILLDHLGADKIILTGITSDICLFFTASDAYLRDYKLIIPSDCSAAVNNDQHKIAMENMERILKAEVCTSAEIDLIQSKKN
ncbi:isochorismatase family cysteine hydrolase [Cytophagaceae bacterium ABcell3]|nr:isochorismatase family cysteine hydrolase [Cytophagaceae bacterium ABcell3]